MIKFDHKSALYEKLRFFKKINLALVLCGALWWKLVKNGVFWPKIDLYSENEVIFVYITNFTPTSIKSLDGVMVSTLNSHPADQGSIPVIS